MKAPSRATVVEEVESTILSREIGRLAGPIMGIGARWAARRLPDVASERRFRAAVPVHELLAASSVVLRDLETAHVELPPMGEEAEVVSVIGSGIQNMNPTLIRVSVSEASRGSLLRVRAVAKEGAIQQRSAELAVERFMNELRARLPENALQSADEGESG